MKSPEQILCKQANQLDLVDYLQELGHQPKKIRGNDYWYLSPLRQENTASFKVNRKMNAWYDHGLGQGGKLVDFGLLYHKCTVKELLEKLGDRQIPNVSFHPQPFGRAGEKKETNENPGKIKILSAGDITDPFLIEYLNERKIPLEIASEYCQQVFFELYNKQRVAIGFKNENGGYELRSPDFKGSSSPKEPRLIQNNGAKDLLVFEGFFSFLSYLALQKAEPEKIPGMPKMQADFQVLNSIAFFEKSRQMMEQYQQVYLFLDRDKMGIQSTQKALQWSVKYKDQSYQYEHYKDLNDFLQKPGTSEIKQSRRRGMRL